MMVRGNLLELQVARPREPQELASFFVDQSVQQDGAVHMASRVDPLFLLLPVLYKHATKWCPLDQALAEGGCGSLRGLKHLDANKLCDVNGERVNRGRVFACEGNRRRRGQEEQQRQTVSNDTPTPTICIPSHYLVHLIMPRPLRAHLSHVQQQRSPRSRSWRVRRDCRLPQTEWAQTTC